MRTLLPEELQEQPLVKLAVGFALLLLAGFVLTGFLLYFQHMSLSPSSVVAHFLGSELDLQPARTYDSMLSVTHAHTVMLAALLLLLSLVLIRSPLTASTKKTFILLPFLFAIADEASSWLVRFVDPGFAWLKIIAFLALQISLIGVILALLAGYFRRARRPFEPLVQEKPQMRPQQQMQQQRRRRPEEGGPRHRPEEGGQQVRPEEGGHRRRRRRPRRRGGRGGQGGQPSGPPVPPAPSA